MISEDQILILFENYTNRSVGKNCNLYLRICWCNFRKKAVFRLQISFNYFKFKMLSGLCLNTLNKLILIEVWNEITYCHTRTICFTKRVDFTTHNYSARGQSHKMHRVSFFSSGYVCATSFPGLLHLRTQGFLYVGGRIPRWQTKFQSTQGDRFC